MKWLLLFITALCTAQSPILPFDEIGDGTVVGAYYKDLDNEFSKFNGTWKFENTSTNTSFTIILQKKEATFLALFNYYQDMMIGEYKYVENGVEIINTLSSLDNTSITDYAHTIAGSIIYKRDTESEGNRPVQLHFEDPQRTYLNVTIMLEYIAPAAGVPAKIKLNWGGSSSLVEDGDPIEIRVPEVEYILTKQP